MAKERENQNQGLWENGVKLDKDQAKAVGLYREVDRVSERADLMRGKAQVLESALVKSAELTRPTYPQAGHDFKMARDVMKDAIARRQELLDLKGVGPVRAIGRIIKAEAIRVREVEPAHDMMQSIKKNNPHLAEDIVKARETAREAGEKCEELEKELERTERQAQTLERRAERLQERADNARDDLGSDRARAVDRTLALEGNAAHAIGHDQDKILEEELSESRGVEVSQEYAVEETYERRIEIER